MQWSRRIEKSAFPLTINIFLRIFLRAKFVPTVHYLLESRFPMVNDNSITPELKAKITPLKMLLLDVDGVLTDGAIIWDDNGVQSKSFNVKDGFGIHALRRLGFKVGIITGKISQVVEHRATELKLDELHQGQVRKVPVYDEIKAKYGFTDAQIAYVGDDLLDMPLLERVGFSAAPADAHPEVLGMVDYVSRHPGGNGAVREVIEFIIKIQGKWETLLSDLTTWERN
jgi:3-deoxy-D-manno-octulosonate 8-phosphate phosphatase (KDO 8-P phosphatase)